jgi:hypothetical protein
VLASAIGAGCDILMTGDVRHFGPLFGCTVGGVAVRSPVDAAGVLLRKPFTGADAPSGS